MFYDILYIGSPPTKLFQMRDPNEVLADFKQRLAEQKPKLKQLYKKRAWPIGIMVVLAITLIICIGWWISDNVKEPIGYYVGLFYGGMIIIGFAADFGEKMAKWFGFKKAEYDVIDQTVHHLEMNIINAKKFIGEIENIKKIKVKASASQCVTLDGYITELTKAVNETPVSIYNNYSFTFMRRSIGAIKGHIGRKRQPITTNAPVIPLTRTASPAITTTPTIPVTPNTSPQGTPSSANGEIPSPKPTQPAPVAKIQEPAPKAIIPTMPPSPAPVQPTPAVVKTPAPPIPPASRVVVQMPPAGPVKPAIIYDEPAEQIITDLDIATLFSPRPSSLVKKITRTRFKRSTIKRTIDYLELYIKNRDIGHLGELFVFEREKDFLVKSGRADLASQVKHVASENDNAGYDVLSFDLSGKEKYIEVKTTHSGYESLFFLSVNEAETMSSLPNYYIYRVYNFDRKSKSGSVYTINCSKEFDRYFQMETAVYKVTPNAR
jgi:hypothetical protein